MRGCSPNNLVTDNAPAFALTISPAKVLRLEARGEMNYMNIPAVFPPTVRDIRLELEMTNDRRTR